MTAIVYQSLMGDEILAPKVLARARRRLSTIVKQAQPAGLWIAHVIRKGDPWLKNDFTVRAPSRYRHTLVGPGDTVIFTRLPRGGRGGASGKSSGGILAAIAAIALVILAPYAAAAAVGALGLAAGSFAATAVTGIVQGAFAIGAAALLQSAQRSKSNKDRREVYSVTGGSNVARPGERRPVIFGRTWTQPPLSQPDVVEYTGDEMVLTKRMTLALGKHQIHTIRVGEATFWTAAGGIQPPFNGTDAGGQPLSAVEFLYEQPSAIVPGDVLSSQSVGGIEAPRQGGNPEWTTWFTSNPSGTTVNRIQLDFQWPQGLGARTRAGKPLTVVGQARFQIRRIDDTGAVLSTLPDVTHVTPALDTSKPWRVTRFIDVAPGRYEVRARNDDPIVDDNARNTLQWDGLRGHVGDTRVRAETTEIVMRIQAAKSLTITSFSDIWVESTSILPVWNGAAWIEQPERRATWAYAHMIRAGWGMNKPEAVDLAKIADLNSRVATFNTFDGRMDDVSSWWEAASQVLHPLRADPIMIGNTLSIVRDEPRHAGSPARHLISRRQIVMDSASSAYSLAGDDGLNDWIVEFDKDGDPRQPREARHTIGAPSRTPKRVQPKGITDPLHAARHAAWLAATSIYRGERRAFKMEWDGRLVTPGDSALIDVWFLDGAVVGGVASFAGNVLTLDIEHGIAVGAAFDKYCSIRRRDGREWAILPCRANSARVIELQASAVSAAVSASGLTLAQALAAADQFPSTVAVSPTLTTLQESFIAKSAVPADQNTVDCEFLIDDARVWNAIGEAVVPPGVAGTGYLTPLVPVAPQIAARCTPHETGIAMAWSVAPTLGAVAYVVEMSYDGSAFEQVSNGPVLSGVWPIRQSETAVTVRAKAIGSTALESPWALTTFTTFAPVVDGGVVAPGTLDIIKLSAEAFNAAEGVSLSIIGEGFDLDQLYQSAEEAQRARETRTLSLKNAFAAASFREQITVIVTDAAALANRTTTLEAEMDGAEARLTTAEQTLVNQQGSISTLQTTLTATTGTANAANATATSALVAAASAEAVAADAQLGLSTLLGGDAASSLLRFASVVDGSGARSTFTIQASATVGGVMQDVGLTGYVGSAGRGVELGGGGALVDLRAQSVRLIDAGVNGGLPVTLLTVSGGKFVFDPLAQIDTPNIRANAVTFEERLRLSGSIAWYQSAINWMSITATGVPGAVVDNYIDIAFDPATDKSILISFSAPIFLTSAGAWAAGNVRLCRNLGGISVINTVGVHGVYSPNADVDAATIYATAYKFASGTGSPLHFEWEDIPTVAGTYRYRVMSRLVEGASAVCGQISMSARIFRR